jgi:hypothetical protein
VIPNPGFGATLRGSDQYAWYTIAWFDKYVARDDDADRLLLTDRWRRDHGTAAVDPAHDGNLYSRDLRSRIDVRRADGSKAVCEDLRAGCGILSDDGSGPFSALDFAYGRQSLRRVRTIKCAAAIRVPRRLDLSRSRGRVKVALRLLRRSRVTLRTRRRHARTRRTSRTLAGGRRKIVQRLRHGSRPGRYRLTVRMRCAGGRQAKIARLRVRH